jgi:hypothetical protein
MSLAGRACFLGHGGRHHQTLKEVTMKTNSAEPKREQILTAMLVLLKAQVALIEMRLAGKTEWEIKP